MHKPNRYDHQKTLANRTMIRSLSLALSLLSVLVAAAQDKNSIQTPPTVAAGHLFLSPKDRMSFLDRVWRLIEEKYYDGSFNGVNWEAIHDRYRSRVGDVKTDEQMYSLLKTMTGELHDVHTRFRTPPERERFRKLKRVSAGIILSEVEGNTVVTEVEEGSEAARAGVESGMIVTDLDDIPLAARLAEARKDVGESSSDRATQLLVYRAMLRGEPGTELKLGVLSADGSKLQVTLTRKVESETTSVIARILPSGHGYVKFPMFNTAVARDFRKKLEVVKNAPSLIIDVRGNGGGHLGAVQQIAGNFLSEKTLLGRVAGRSGKRPSFVLRLLGISGDVYAGHNGGQVYAGPVVILINESSGSGAEIFSGGMQEIGRATIVGRQSCGCVLVSVSHDVEGSELDISEFSIVTGKGRRLEGSGVVPDKPVPLNLTDLRSDRDPALAEAEKLLENALHHAEFPVITRAVVE